MNLFKWSWQKTKGYRKNFILLLFVVIIIAIFNILNAASFKLILDIAAREIDFPLWIGMMIPIGVVLVASVSKGLQTYWSNKTVLGISKNIKREFMSHVEKMPLTEYNKYHSGDLLNRLSDDATKSSELYPMYLLNFLTGTISCIFAFVYAFYLSWKLTVIVILIAPLVVIWSKLLVPKLNLYVKEVRHADSKMKSYAQEQLTDIMTIKSFESYKSSINKYNILFGEFANASLKKICIEVFMRQGGNVLGYLSFAGTVSLGAYLCLQGEITLGTIVGFAQLLNYIIWPFTEAVEIFTNIQTGFVSVERIKKIMDLPEEEKDDEIAFDNTLDNNEVSMVLEHVGFSYNEKEEIINNLNVEFKAGQFIGIGGKSGQGKSTLMKLMLGLYKTTSGEIALIIHGKRYKGVNMRKWISYVPQEHMLFSGSIRENLCLGNENATQDEIEEAAKKANIHDFIKTLDHGYDTVLDEKGNNISFGQAQRIAIVRALLKNTPIILMDEPTASLDKTSEAIVMDILRKESEHKLCIVVSHTVVDSKKYDKWLLLQEGIATIY